MRYCCWILALVVSIGATGTGLLASPPDPQKVELFEHRSVTAWSCVSAGVQALVYQSGMAIDADGAYRAYHPDSRLGLDNLANAGHPGNWWALATDTGNTNGTPVIQQKGDPAPGYYVSMTSLYDASIEEERNPRRFVDAATIPYVVLPPEAFKYAKLGDLATVVNHENGKVAGGIVADESAPKLPMGEGSIALANLLGIDSNARNGGTDRGVVYVIYPRSGNGKPRKADAIAKVANTYFEKWGGREKLRSCLR